MLIFFKRKLDNRINSKNKKIININIFSVLLIFVWLGLLSTASYVFWEIIPTYNAFFLEYTIRLENTLTEQLLAVFNFSLIEKLEDMFYFSITTDRSLLLEKLLILVTKNKLPNPNLFIDFKELAASIFTYEQFEDLSVFRIILNVAILALLSSLVAKLLVVLFGFNFWTICIFNFSLLILTYLGIYELSIWLKKDYINYLYWLIEESFVTRNTYIDSNYFLTNDATKGIERFSDLVIPWLVDNGDIEYWGGNFKTQVQTDRIRERERHFVMNDYNNQLSPNLYNKIKEDGTILGTIEKPIRRISYWLDFLNNIAIGKEIIESSWQNTHIKSEFGQKFINPKIVDSVWGLKNKQILNPTHFEVTKNTNLTSKKFKYNSANTATAFQYGEDELDFILPQKNNIVGDSISRVGNLRDRKQIVYRGAVNNLPVVPENQNIDFRRPDFNKNTNYIFEKTLQNERSREYNLKEYLKKYLKYKLNYYQISILPGIDQENMERVITENTEVLLKLTEKEISILKLNEYGQKVRNFNKIKNYQNKENIKLDTYLLNLSKVWKSIDNSKKRIYPRKFAFEFNLVENKNIINFTKNSFWEETLSELLKESRLGVGIHTYRNSNTVPWVLDSNKNFQKWNNYVSKNVITKSVANWSDIEMRKFFKELKGMLEDMGVPAQGNNNIFYRTTISILNSWSKNKYSKQELYSKLDIVISTLAGAESTDYKNILKGNSKTLNNLLMTYLRTGKKKESKESKHYGIISQSATKLRVTKKNLFLKIENTSSPNFLQQWFKWLKGIIRDTFLKQPLNLSEYSLSKQSFSIDSPFSLLSVGYTYKFSQMKYYSDYRIKIYQDIEQFSINGAMLYDETLNKVIENLARSGAVKTYQTYVNLDYLEQKTLLSVENIPRFYKQLRSALPEIDIVDYLYYVFFDWQLRLKKKNTQIFVKLNALRFSNSSLLALVVEYSNLNLVIPKLKKEFKLVQSTKYFKQLESINLIDKRKVLAYVGIELLYWNNPISVFPFTESAVKKSWIDSDIQNSVNGDIVKKLILCQRYVQGYILDYEQMCLEFCDKEIYSNSFLEKANWFQMEGALDSIILNYLGENPYKLIRLFEDSNWGNLGDNLLNEDLYLYDFFNWLGKYEIIWDTNILELNKIKYNYKETMYSLGKILRCGNRSDFDLFFNFTRYYQYYFSEIFIVIPANTAIEIYKIDFNTKLKKLCQMVANSLQKLLNYYFKWVLDLGSSEILNSKKKLALVAKEKRNFILKYHLSDKNKIFLKKENVKKYDVRVAPKLEFKKLMVDYGISKLASQVEKKDTKYGITFRELEYFWVETYLNRELGLISKIMKPTKINTLFYLELKKLNIEFLTYIVWKPKNLKKFEYDYNHKYIKNAYIMRQSSSKIINLKTKIFHSLFKNKYMVWGHDLSQYGDSFLKNKKINIKKNTKNNLKFIIFKKIKPIFGSPLKQTVVESAFRNAIHSKEFILEKKNCFKKIKFNVSLLSKEEFLKCRIVLNNPIRFEKPLVIKLNNTIIKKQIEYLLGKLENLDYVYYKNYIKNTAMLFISGFELKKQRYYSDWTKLQTIKIVSVIKQFTTVGTTSNYRQFNQSSFRALWLQINPVRHNSTKFYNRGSVEYFPIGIRNPKSKPSNSNKQIYNTKMLE